MKFPQSTAQHPADVEGNFRVLPHDFRQFTFMEDQQGGLLVRADRGGARCVFEKSHFAEVVARSDSAQFDVVISVPVLC